MPDWLLSIIYIAIISSTLLLITIITGSAWGIVLGLLGGHFIASVVLKHLPGFWDK